MGGILGGGKGGGNTTLPTSFSASTPAFNLSGGLSGDSVSGTLTPLGSNVQTAFDDRFPRILGDLDTLRSTFTPGFSQLREARAAAVENARTRAIGNLKDNLSRRKIEGSSFAGNALVRAERDFAQEAAAQSAQSFLEETAANQALLQQEQQQIAFGVEKELAEIGLASGFIQGIGSIISQNAATANQLAQNERAGLGSLLGTAATIGLAAAALPSATPSFFDSIAIDPSKVAF